jgi:hypothetical protein
MRALHFPESHGALKAVDSNLDIIDMPNLWDYREPAYDGGQINHYWCKSFQEFALKKRRGDELRDEGRQEYERAFATFFDWNAPENRQNFTPPAADLLARVKRETDILRGIPEVALIERRILSGLPNILKAYDNVGGLEQIFRRRGAQ